MRGNSTDMWPQSIGRIPTALSMSNLGNFRDQKRRTHAFWRIEFIPIGLVVESDWRVRLVGG